MAEKHNADQVKIESGRLKTELASASEIATKIDCQELEPSQEESPQRMPTEASSQRPKAKALPHCKTTS